MSEPHLLLMRATLLMYSCALGIVLGQVVPKGYVVPPITTSLDQRFGVTVPTLASQGLINHPENRVIELKTGKLLGKLQSGSVTYDHSAHGGIEPTLWSADDSFLLWQVEGKWGAEMQILAHLRNGEIGWQVDVLKNIRQEILQRTRAALPEKYAEVKSQSAVYGSWSEDGFEIDSVPDSKDINLTFPLVFHVFLTSNLKQLKGVVTVDSRMTAELSEDGKIKVDEFHLGQAPPAPGWGWHSGN